MDPTICETCWHYDYDEEYEEYYCRMDMDEDEFARVVDRKGGRGLCCQRGDD